MWASKCQRLLPNLTSSESAWQAMSAKRIVAYPLANQMLNATMRSSGYVSHRGHQTKEHVKQ